MTFIYPHVLYLLIFIPVYIFLYFYFEKKKKKDIIPFGNLEVLMEAASKTSKGDFLKYLPISLKSLLLVSLILALSRPLSTVYLPMRDTKIMLLLDTSISMEASDIEPSRIRAAREAAKEFIKKLPSGIRIGIALFSGSVKVLVNPELERKKVLNVLNRLSTKILQPGTAIGDAILAGVEAITLDDTSKRKARNNGDRILL